MQTFRRKVEASIKATKLTAKLRRQLQRANTGDMLVFLGDTVEVCPAEIFKERYEAVGNSQRARRRRMLPAFEEELDKILLLAYRTWGAADFSTGELAAGADDNVRTLGNRLSSLTRRGFVTKSGAGRNVRWRVSKKGEVAAKALHNPGSQPAPNKRETS